MLVYLDTADFATLERASGIERHDFQVIWDKNGCELALSFHHFQEIAQLNDEESIKRRFRLFNNFKIIRGENISSSRAFRLEIIKQLMASGFMVASNQIDFQSALFPPLPAAEMAEICDVIIHSLKQYNMLQNAQKMGAASSNYAKQAQNGLKPNFRKKVDMELLNSPDVESLFKSSISGLPAELQNIVISNFSTLKNAIEEEGTPRAALVTLFGLSGLGEIKDVPDSDLPLVAHFFDIAKELLGELSSNYGLTLADSESVLNTLNPYRSISFLLHASIESARGQHPKEDVASDDVDTAHICFAPYVDLLFVDKRTAGFLRQEATKKPSLQDFLEKGIIKQGGTLERVAEAIEAKS